MTLCIHKWENIALDIDKIFWRCTKCANIKYQELLKQNHICFGDIPRYAKSKCFFWHRWKSIRIGDYIDTRETKPVHSSYKIQVCERCNNIKEVQAYGIGSDGRSRPPVCEREIVLNPDSDCIF